MIEKLYHEHNSPFILSFHANDLLQFRDDFHQVGLISHYLFDVFIRAGNFVDDARIFAAFDAFCLTFEVVARELFLRRRARHLATSAVRAGIIALLVSKPLDDKRFRAHRAGNNSVSTRFGVNRAFARHVNLFAEMFFERDVIVMSVDRNFRLKLFALIKHLVKLLQKTLHHHFAILHRVALRPIQIVPVIPELIGSLNKICEIRVGKLV